MNALRNVAIIASCVAVGIVLLRRLDVRRGDADLIHLDERRAAMRAALTIAAPEARHDRASGAVDFFFGLSGSPVAGEGRPAASLIGTSWSKVDRPTPVSALPVGTGTFEQSAKSCGLIGASKRDALYPRRLSAVPSVREMDRTADLLARRDDAPSSSGRRGI